ncbi:alpha/beta fold hydrolase [Rhodococcus gordoniae]|uniref:alpha/beta fold hydrolase n=1 Tax=Rhodococcus gordoniae TaxID=223392 RepID=UPI0020CEC2E0|nr:alpha/beta hydrolase [Rhodococcus gordoniae]UTT48083.1 alpha/beta hydrolase [Rhodococcus gordoniae]
MPELVTRTIDLPGATLVYDVRPVPGGATPLLLAGSPMDASGFTGLASCFDDRTVITYDPRGTGRGTRTDTSLQSTPALHADDLHRILVELDLGPVDVFASSGGAVNALELVSRHPEQVRTLVAHEPPILELLPDRASAEAVRDDIHDTYQRSGLGPAMAKFIALISYEGELTSDHLGRPSPNPSDFGLPTKDDGTRDDVLLSQNWMSCTGYRADLDALASASTRIVVAGGRESARQLCGRTAAALADRLGTIPTLFPGDHGGFMGAEQGMPGDPEAFAAVLRDVLQPSRV